MKSFIVFLLLLFFIPDASAHTQNSLPYKEYLSQVLAYYPSLKKEHASIEKAIANKAVEAAAHMPHFWASIGSDYGNDPVYVFGALLRQNRFTNSDFALDRLNTPKSHGDNSAVAGVEWTLFDFSRTTNKIKAASLLTESAEFKSELTQMEAILAASELYGRLSTTDRLLQVVSEEVQKSQEDILAIESLSRKGLALGADFYLARMTHAQLLELKNDISSQRAALCMAFNVLRGADPLTPVSVSMDFSRAPFSRNAVEDYIRKAVTNRFDIRSLAKTLEAGDLAISTQKKSIAPSIVAYGNVSEHSKNFSKSGGESYMVGVKAKIDLDPAYTSRIKLVKAEAKKLSAQLQEAKDQAVRDVSETYYRLQAIESNIILAKQSSDDATKALYLIAPLYKEGRRSIADMLSTRMAKVSAFERWLKLESACRLTALSLQLLTGDLNPALAEDIYGQ